METGTSASNPAFHWILNDPATCFSNLEAIFKSIKPGRAFFEMCGHGNAAKKMTLFDLLLRTRELPSKRFEIKMIGLKSEAHPVASAGMEEFMRPIPA
ncbi:hypothetical protein N7508_000631 [Penicillium antarcticum]|uniref:uncharacterized protein n=1 Tax=Penicillium antarcticum TaxID=416450 RepID=UPI0023830696|nr:uncharacterized protein N7508_000631 [Penicillium antarcticum]KAJ5320348.1 hypothetical protein N7508_000631 [Penicillium antarcticum]